MSLHLIYTLLAKNQISFFLNKTKKNATDYAADFINLRGSTEIHEGKLENIYGSRL